MLKAVFSTWIFLPEVRYRADAPLVCSPVSGYAIRSLAPSARKSTRIFRVTEIGEAQVADVHGCPGESPLSIAPRLTCSQLALKHAITESIRSHISRHYSTPYRSGCQCSAAALAVPRTSAPPSRPYLRAPSSALVPSACYLKPDGHSRTTLQHVPSARPAPPTVLSCPRLRTSPVCGCRAFSLRSNDNAFARPASDSASRSFADEQFRAGMRNPQLAVPVRQHCRLATTARSSVCCCPSCISCVPASC